MTQHLDKVFWKIGLLSIAIISAGFMLIDDKYTILLLLINCLLQFYLSKKIHVDTESILLFIGMLAYGIGSKFTPYLTIKCTLLPFLFYFYGVSVLSSQNKADREYRIKALILVLSLGMLLESILNNTQWTPEYGRNWPEFWSGQFLPATQHVFYNLCITGMIFYGVIYWRKNRLLNSILVLGGTYCLWYSLITASRMLVVIFALVLAANIALYFYLNWNNKASHLYLYILLAILLATAALICVLYVFNIGGFYDYMHSYMWTRDGGILHNVRFQAHLAVLKQLFKYPFGGKLMDLAGLEYAHNVWLDAANSSGIFPFFLLTAYAALTLYNLIKLIRTQAITHETKYLLVSSYLSLFLFYMVETALEANIMLWAPWALVCGLIKGVQKENTESVATKESNG